ncbi:iron(III) dicitrate TonB-dependent receptor [Escherichia coli]|uniref:Iron(III) dicitrate TonB-dependent receptor n=1 Tax=Escherichia coli TaxID=562 RepID=A0A376X589_ECOLX|nr:iron(III) dicitrate TonB-dependent receptor [Escherichia coli]
MVRGGGAVRYGPQSVGGVVNFVTRAIPQDFGIERRGRSAQPNLFTKQPERDAQPDVGGTADNGFGTGCSTPARAAVTARAQRHPHRRPDAESKYAPDECTPSTACCNITMVKPTCPVACLARITTRSLAIHPARMTASGVVASWRAWATIPARQPA